MNGGDMNLWHRLQSLVRHINRRPGTIERHTVARVEQQALARDREQAMRLKHIQTEIEIMKRGKP